MHMKARLVLVGLAALVQAGTVIALGATISGGDAWTYLAISDDWLAWSTLLSPEAFENNFWPAGYPGVLAVFSAFGEAQVMGVRLLHVLLAAAVALMAGSMVDRVSHRAGTATTAIIAASPTMLWAVWAVGYEMPLAFLLTAGLLIATRERVNESALLSLAGGLFLGLALLMQFRAALAVAFLVIVVLRRHARRAAWLAAGIAVPVLAWAARSWVATGNPAPWSANGPYNLWNGNNPQATGHNVFPLPPLPPDEDSYTSAAISWIADNPVDFLNLTIRKFTFLFEPTRLADVTDPFMGESLVAVFEIGLAVFIAGGLIAYLVLRLLRSAREISFLDAPFGFAMAYLLPNILFIVEPRFSIPVHAILVAISMSVFLWMVRWLRSRQRSTALAANRAS